MPKVSAPRSKTNTDALKHKITGSTLLLAVVGLVVFGVMQPADVHVSHQDLASGKNSEADAQQPRPELLAIAVQSQRLIEAMRNTEESGTLVPESDPVESVDVVRTVSGQDSQVVEASQPQPVQNEVALAVSKPATQSPVSKPKKKEPASSASADDWYLQVGAFKNFTNAELLGLEARSVGFGTLLQENGSGSEAVVKLLIGPYPTQRDALADKSNLEKSDFVKKNKIDGVFVVKAGSQ